MTIETLETMAPITLFMFMFSYIMTFLAGALYGMHIAMTPRDDPDE